jgi:hypothetical protein
MRQIVHCRPRAAGTTIADFAKEPGISSQMRYRYDAEGKKEGVSHA